MDITTIRIFKSLGQIVITLLIVTAFSNGEDLNPHDIIAGLRHAHTLQAAARKYNKESNIATQPWLGDALTDAVEGIVTRAQEVLWRADEVLAREGELGLGAEAGNTSTVVVVSETCLNHTQLMLAGIPAGEKWALRMFDAFGKPGSGILDLQLTWPGSYDECVAVEALVNATDGDNRTTSHSPFRGRYCSASFPLGQPVNMTGPTVTAMALTIGLCVPSSCSPEDTAGLVDWLFGLIPLNTSSLPEPVVTCKFDDLELSNTAIAVMSVCAVFGALMLVGTTYDILVLQGFGSNLCRPPADTDGIAPTYDLTETYENRIPNGEPNCDKIPLLIGNGGDKRTYTTEGDDTRGLTGNGRLRRLTSNTETTEKDHLHRGAKKESTGHTAGALGKILQSFSVYSNARKILSTSQPAGSLSAVNGIRFLSMSWVILGHTYGFGVMFLENMTSFFPQMVKRLTFQAVGNATFSVDTFFCLSGLLVAYLSLKEMKKVGGAKKFKWGMYYFHRFWRLTPPYMLFLMLYVPTIKYWSNGPFWSQTGVEVDECRDTWWKNLLYVNNLVEPEKQCMGWSWYLANDMQFFIISPLLLIPLFYSRLLGTVTCLLFVIATCVTTGVISAVDNLDASILTGNFGNTFVDIYIKPWCRIGPYVVGTYTGYLLYTTRCKIRIPHLMNVLGWAAAAVVALLVVYGLWEPATGIRDLSTGESALYNATSRTAWGACVCWVIFACATGHGGPVNQLLSWRIWVPLSRLTYCAYLVHPVVMYTYYMSRHTLMYWYDLQMIYLFVGHLFVSYAAAFVVSLAFESPMMGLEKVLLRRDKH